MEEREKKKLTWKGILALIVSIAIAVPLCYGFFLIAFIFVYASSGNIALAMFIGLLPTLIIVATASISMLLKRREKA